MEYLLLHCGHLRSLRWVSVMVTGDLDGSSKASSELMHAILCPICGVLRVCSKDQALELSDPDARADVHWPLAEVSAVIGMARGSGCARESKG